MEISSPIAVFFSSWYSTVDPSAERSYLPKQKFLLLLEKVSCEYVCSSHFTAFEMAQKERIRELMLSPSGFWSAVMSSGQELMFSLILWLPALCFRQFLSPLCTYNSNHSSQANSGNEDVSTKKKTKSTATPTCLVGKTQAIQIPRFLPLLYPNLLCDTWWKSHHCLCFLSFLRKLQTCCTWKTWQSALASVK